MFPPIRRTSIIVLSLLLLTVVAAGCGAGPTPAPQQTTPSPWLSATVPTAQQTATSTPPPEAVMAPPFTLPDLEGKMVSLSQFRGKPVLLFFWATW